MEMVILLILVSAAAAPLAIAVFKWWSGRRAMADALLDACLICDSKNVDMRDDGMDYACGECGYDSTMARRPDVRELVDQLRDVREARRAFSEAARMMKKAHGSAATDVMMNNSQKKYYYLEQAAERQIEGLTMIRDVAKRYPQLLDMHVAGSKVSGSGAKEMLFDNVFSDIRVKNEIKESRKQVDAYLVIVNSLYDHLIKSILDKCNLEDGAVQW